MPLEKSTSKDLSHSQVRGKAERRGAVTKPTQNQEKRPSRRYREATPNNRQFSKNVISNRALFSFIRTFSKRRKS